MKSSSIYQNFLYSLPFFLCIQTASLFAQTPKSYTWHDGNRSHTVWIVPDQMAELVSSGSISVTKMDSGARIVKKSGGVRIWKIGSPAMIKSLQNGEVPQQLKGKVSPVFSSSQQGGSIRALPGNIIISFNSSWGASEIGSFAKANNLEIIEKLKIKGNVFLIKTELGLAALDLANKIRTLPGVLAAFPDWWVEMHTR